MVGALAALSAIVLAEGDLASVRIAGLTVRERAVRIARRVGATEVVVVDSAAARAALAVTGDVLVIRVDQLVHTPLVQPLLDAPGDLVVADDGSYAGAFVARGAVAAAAVAALAGGATDTAFVAARPEAPRVRPGAVARHPIATAAERRAAHKLLYQILIKPQDNAITRYLYRPVSFPLTRLLVWTPITPNQVSYLVACFVALGCYLTADGSMNRAIAGTATILAGSYLDCCDGEIARIKLLSSKWGAWLDTIVDELSSVGYMAALGWHCHQHFGPGYLGGGLGFDPWLAAIVLGVVTYGGSIYGVYYNIIVVVGSANSQDYVGRFEVVPGSAPDAVRLRPAATQAVSTKQPLPPALQWIATYAPYVIRRDFISWAALAFAITHLTHVSFATQVLGGVVTFVIVGIDHLRLRRQRRAIARSGKRLEAR
jgi:phosphatidylglycerophosphate synthase